MRRRAALKFHCNVLNFRPPETSRRAALKFHCNVLNFRPPETTSRRAALKFHCNVLNFRPPEVLSRTSRSTQQRKLAPRGRAGTPAPRHRQ
jgi:hypothetical protein